jgi:hypothetical protein
MLLGKKSLQWHLNFPLPVFCNFRLLLFLSYKELIMFFPCMIDNIFVFFTHLLIFSLLISNNEISKLKLMHSQSKHFSCSNKLRQVEKLYNQAESMTDRERMQISTRHPVMFVSIMDGIKC